MSNAKRLDSFAPMARVYGMTLAYVPSDDPQLIDDEIDIYCESVKTNISIQIGQCGHYYINEHIYKDGALEAVRPHGEYRSLAVALDRALGIAAKESLHVN